MKRSGEKRERDRKKKRDNDDRNVWLRRKRSYADERCQSRPLPAAVFKVQQIKLATH